MVTRSSQHKETSSISLVEISKKKKDYCFVALHLSTYCKVIFYIWCKQEKCTLSLHSNIALGWHAVAITLEDYPASTTNFQSATPYSHVSLQFLVHVSPSSGPCNRAPVLIGQSPNDGSCEEVSNGNTFNSVIEAKHIDSSRRYVLLLYP